MSGTILPVVLAAGSASRFNGDKLNRDCAGQPVAAWVLKSLEEADSGHGVIIAREPAPAFAEAFAGWRIIVNDRPELGIGRSIKLAAEAAIEQGAGGLLVALGDMPIIPPAHFAQLFSEQHRGTRAVATRYPDGKTGVPACFGADLLPELTTLSGDSGAGALLSGEADLVTLAANPDWLIDIDTVEGLRRAAGVLKRREDRP